MAEFEAQNAVRIAPYGSWASPITAACAAAAGTRAEWVDFVGEQVWWTELRPGEGGRSALVGWAPDGTVTDLLGAAWSVRSRVIEYGGRPWLALGQEHSSGFVFTHGDDQRVYRSEPGAEPWPLSPAPEVAAGLRYADFARVGDEVWCLRETLLDPAGTEVRRALVALPLDGSAADAPDKVRILGSSHHLMTGPKVSPDGRHVAWIGWNHPDMPWDTTDLMRAEVRSDNTLGPARRVAGGPGVSVGQVEWAPDRPGYLYTLCDPEGWWNLYEIDPQGGSRPLCRRAEEFGEPLWRIGARWFLPADDGRLFVAHGTSDRRLALLHPDGSLVDVASPYTEWAQLATDGRRVAGTAAAPRLRSCVALVDPGLKGSPGPQDFRLEILSGSGPEQTAAGIAEWLPHGRHEVFRNARGEDVHAFVHLPHNPAFAAPAGELPPFLVQAHGGPTTRGQLVLNTEIAYFTSRGIGVVEVQYGGSTGFGRAYRERLRHNWGVVDVQDCAAVARGLVERRLADPERTGIRGGSAGGWTAAASLAAEPSLYRVAGIYYPLLDPEEWRDRGTHDFESRYLESLLGPWPQAAERYARVSPLRRADQVRAPFVIMQGLDDPITPPSQAERYLARLGSAVPHAYLTFEGEQHGFRRAETVEACLHAELSLYGQVFGFEPPGVRRLRLSS
ncbi:prolyl oligopeptidase family serine peptidase [Streptomyces sp. bgisy091]|uniref:prolyl oligopeptidase family serine peptidase n=1 Tax=Streptomyces sp. bgisy091 TaxID=3413778 RepID=UPI003D726921